ncbi:MAG: hypothetical protein IT293_18275 [Deltaproteobacteria bacterium]|nr:hypothetical protein [Deltaproteobacteria bacterium]
MIAKTTKSTRVAFCALALLFWVAPAVNAGVTIEIPNDLCSDASGEVTVPLRMTNDEPVRAIFAKLVSPSGGVDLVASSARCSGRAQGFSCQASTVAANGHINLIVLSLGGQVLPAGDGSIMTLRLRLANSICDSSPDTELGLRDVDVANPANQPIAAQAVDGRAACTCQLAITDARQVAKCQPAVAAGTQALVVKRLRTLSTCGAALLDCEQTKPGDLACEGKAKEKCSKALGALPATTEKFVAAVEKGCADVEQTTMLSARGLDFGQIADDCGDNFGGSVGSTEAIARCVAAQHACRAEEVMTSAMPRVRELAEDAQVPLGADNCLGDFAKSRIALSTAGAAGKPVVACQKAIVTGGSRYVSTALKRLDGCVAKVLRCLQLKPGNAGCLTKAERACVKQLDTGLPALAEKLGRGIGKRCATPFATLASEQGLGLAKLEQVCRAVGVDTLGSLADYQRCLIRRYQCLVRDLLQFGTPRADEVLRLVGDTSPSFCH